MRTCWQGSQFIIWLISERKINWFLIMKESEMIWKLNSKANYQSLRRCKMKCKGSRLSDLMLKINSWKLKLQNRLTSTWIQQLRPTQPANQMLEVDVQAVEPEEQRLQIPMAWTPSKSPKSRESMHARCCLMAWGTELPWRSWWPSTSSRWTKYMKMACKKFKDKSNSIRISLWMKIQSQRWSFRMRFSNFNKLRVILSSK